VLANATPFGLSVSVFTADAERGRRVAEQIDSGMVFVNQPAWTAPSYRSAESRVQGSGANCRNSDSASL
jgi:acyl-CoA reductase-like NAD-dependent aldehyde dehydrogenase